MLGLSFEEFVLILSTVTYAGYFRFNNSYYKQIDGLDMGVKAAPPFAIIYVYLTVEKPLLENDFTSMSHIKERCIRFYVRTIY